jgi:hypothetical protein
MEFHPSRGVRHQPSRRQRKMWECDECTFPSESKGNITESDDIRLSLAIVLRWTARRCTPRDWRGSVPTMLRQRIEEINSDSLSST